MRFIEKLAVDGYEENEDCMPVILVEKLEESIGTEKPMEYFICTLSLKEEVDGLPDHVIGVGRKFLKLPKKRKLALIHMENEKLRQSRSREFETNKGVEAAASAEVIKEFGMWTYRRAIRKVERFERGAMYRATKGVHRDYVRQIKEPEDAERQEQGMFDEEIENNIPVSEDRSNIEDGSKGDIFDGTPAESPA